MPSLGLGLGLGFGGAPRFEPEALTLFSAMTVQPSGARKAVINARIAALKAAGIWDRADRIYVPAAHSEQAARLDWKNPGTDSLTTVGSVKFIADRGFFGYAANGQVQNAVAFSDLPQYSQDDAHVSIWQTRGISFRRAIGTETDQLCVGLYPFISGGTQRLQAGVNVTSLSEWDGFNIGINDDFPLIGFFMANRKDAADHYAFYNGVSLGAVARASTATLFTSPHDARVLAGVRNTNSGVALLTAGANLESEAAAVFEIFNDYMVSVKARHEFVSSETTNPAWSFDFISNPSLESPEGFQLQSMFGDAQFDATMVIDWEGVPWLTDPLEVPFAGYRRIKNLFAAPTAILETQGVATIAGTYVVSFTGTGTITFSGAATGSLVGQGAGLRVAKTLTTTAGTLTCTVSGDVRNAQCENVTWQSNQNPAEYVSVGDLPYPCHGAVSDGVKYFTTENGNTVSSELVTEATGAALNVTTVLKGLQLQVGVTNRCLQSENFGTTWSAVGTPTRIAAADNCGYISLDLIGDDDGAALEGYTQNITFTDTDATQTDNNVKAISLFFKEGTTASSVIRLRDTTAGADRLLATITWAAGVPTVTMTTGLLDGTDELTNGVYRARMRATPVTIAATTNQLQIYPATDAALDTTLTGNIYIGGVEADDYPIATSYVRTTIAAVARANAMIGDFSYFGNVLSWVNQTEGTFVSESLFDREWGTWNNSGLNQQYIYSLKDITQGSNDRLIHVRFDDAAPNVSFKCIAGGVDQMTLQADSWPVDTIMKCGFAYKTNDCASSVNGSAVTTDTSVTLPDNLNEFSVGSTQFGTRSGSAHFYLRKLSYYRTRLSDSALPVATA